MSTEYSDGIAFRYKMPKEDVALRGVCINEEGKPKLLFDVAKKVPTITEEEVAMCIRVVHNDNERPRFYYRSFLPNHPLAGTDRRYKSYEPLYMRRTSMGENLAEIDWNMKCLSIGVRTDKEKEKFFSWPETSQIDGLKSYENFPPDPLSEPSGVYMKCKSVPVFEDSSQLLFPEEPKMMIEWKRYPSYSNYITEHFDSVAYFDEPLFLKMKEYIKLILVVEWLKKKNVQFSQNWIQEQTAPSLDPPKPLRVELSPEERKSITKILKKETKKAVQTSKLKQALPSSKYKDRISATSLTIKEDSRGFEATFERTIADPVFEKCCDLYVPVVQKVVARATTHDLDFLYAGIDPNQPVVFDADANALKTPEVSSWSELTVETEMFPCKWIQDPNDITVRTPALTGGISTASIPVQPVIKAPRQKPRIEVTATKSKERQKVQSCDIPSQAVVPAPSSSAHVSSAVATGGSGASVMHGFESFSSSCGMSQNGTKISQAPLHTHTTITQLIGGEEIGPPLNISMHLPGLPKAESVSSDDSAYVSSRPSLESIATPSISDSGIGTTPFYCPHEAVELKRDGTHGAKIQIHKQLLPPHARTRNLAKECANFSTPKKR